jgi:hypothetical protein
MTWRGSLSLRLRSHHSDVWARGGCVATSDRSPARADDHVQRCQPYAACRPRRITGARLPSAAFDPVLREPRARDAPLLETDFTVLCILMSATTLVVVLVAIALAYALGKRATTKRPGASAPEESASRDLAAVENARAKIEEMLATWCAILDERRDLTADEQERYRNFVMVAHATSKAARAGRTFTPSELNESIRWRDTRLAEAETLRAQLPGAGEKWQAETEAGIKDGPAGAHVHDLVKRYEHALRDAGEVNALREWRAGLNNSAGQLGLSDLLTGAILQDASGPLAPAERRFMNASVRARLGDPSDLNAAAAAIERQNGSTNLTLTQTNRIAEALEREGEQESKADEGRNAARAVAEARRAAEAADAGIHFTADDEDLSAVQRMQSADAAWAARMDEILATRTPDAPPVRMLDEEEANFFQFASAKQAIKIAQAAGRPGIRYTPDDLAAGRSICEQKSAAARALIPELKQAHELWSAEIHRTGELVCPAGDKVQALSQQVEDLAFDGGSFNVFVWALSWRRAVSEAFNKKSSPNA